MSETEKIEELIQNEENLNQSEEEIWNKYKCCKCYVQVDDLKTYKTHLWENHLKKLEIMRQNSFSAKKTQPRQSNGNAKKKRKIESIKLKSESDQSNSSLASISDTDTEDDLMTKIEKLSPEEYKYFNLDNIDEEKVLERALKRYNPGEDRAVAIQKSRIGWAKWRTVMWPCIIEKYAKTSSNSYRVFIRYYEPSNQKGNIFKLPLPNVNIFFHSSEHFEIKVQIKILINFEFNFFINKENSATNFDQKHEFFLCYTKALKDCINFLDEQEAKDSLDHFEKVDSKKVSDEKKFIVNGAMYNLNEIKDIVQQEMSLEQSKINQEREKNSKELADILLTDELEQHLISIFNEEINCKRHINYIKGDVNIRKKMKFSSPGPLVEADQQKLAGFINNISKTKYTKKSELLINYEYDVLYPEVFLKK